MADAFEAQRKALKDDLDGQIREKTASLETRLTTELNKITSEDVAGEKRTELIKDIMQQVHQAINDMKTEILNELKTK